MTEQPDPVIHPSVRLKIMSALKPLPPGGTLEFLRLRSQILARIRETAGMKTDLDLLQTLSRQAQAT